jgi:hypothetical protein
MNPGHEQQLEAAIRREMDALGELPAPPALAGRVLRAIERRAAAPWHRRAWQTWPPALQGVSLAALLVLFGGICLGVVELSQAAETSAALQQAGEWFTGFEALWKTAGVLAGAAAAAFQQLGTGFLLGCGLALLAAYGACVGLGVACARLALARR